jgi:hypothetical protein
VCGEGISKDLFSDVSPIKASCIAACYSNPLTKGYIKSGMVSGKMAAEEIINEK